MYRCAAAALLDADPDGLITLTPGDHLVLEPTPVRLRHAAVLPGTTRVVNCPEIGVGATSLYAFEVRKPPRQYRGSLRRKAARWSALSEPLFARLSGACADASDPCADAPARNASQREIALFINAQELPPQSTREPRTSSSQHGAPSDAGRDEAPVEACVPKRLSMATRDVAVLRSALSALSSGRKASDHPPPPPSRKNSGRGASHTAT